MNPVSKFGKVAAPPPRVPPRPPTEPPSLFIKPSPLTAIDAGPSTPAVPRAPSPQQQQESAVARIFFVILLADLFFTFSRILEFFPVHVGPVSLSVACRSAVFLFAFFSGQALAIAGSPISKRLLMFTLWFIVAIPFSSWKGGSVDLLLHFWLPSIFAFIGTNALLDSTGKVRKCLYVMAFSGAVIVVLSIVFSGGATNFRVELQESGTLGNANDLAMALLLGIPGTILYFQLHKRGYYASRLFLLASLPFLLRTVAGTASRAGVLSLLLFAVALFWSASHLARVRVAVLALITAVLFFASAPKSTLLRYATILPFVSIQPTTWDEEKIQESAEASAQGRRRLLEQSLIMTLRHPLLGVGPGQFQTASAEISKQEGRRAEWHETHNTFTQISSECGIPAFLFYISALICSFRAAMRIRKKTLGVPGLEVHHRTAFCILLLLSFFTLNGFFGGLAYLPLFPFLAALADGFERNAAREISEWERARTPAIASAPGGQSDLLRLKPALS